MKINLELLPHQAEFVGDMTHRYNALVGGFGSGKTRAFCAKAIMLAAHNIGYKGVLMSPTHGMNKREVMPQFEEMLYECDIPFKPVKSLDKYILQFGQGRTEIFFLSAENHIRARNMNLAFFGIDELDIMKTEDADDCWNTMISRLRVGKVFQGFVTTTPEGFKFTYQYFVEKANDTKRLIQASTEDNIFLPQSYIDDLRAQWPSNLVDAYINGQFVNLTSGSVYPNFDRYESNTNLTLEDFPTHPLHIGVDFNVYNMSAIINTIDKGNVYAIDEIVKEKNTESLIRALKEQFPNKKIYCYPDSSGKSEHSNASITDINLLKMAGFECFYKGVNPRIVNRVNSMNARLLNMNGDRRLLINVKRCPTLTRSFEQQAYDKGKPDKSNDLDHTVDAEGYFIYYRFPLRKGSIQSEL